MADCVKDGTKKRVMEDKSGQSEQWKGKNRKGPGLVNGNSMAWKAQLLQERMKEEY